MPVIFLLCVPVAAPNVGTADHSVGVMRAPEIRSGSRAVGRLETASQMVSISGSMVGLNGLVADHCRILGLASRCSMGGVSHEVKNATRW